MDCTHFRNGRFENIQEFCIFHSGKIRSGISFDDNTKTNGANGQRAVVVFNSRNGMRKRECVLST